MSQQNMSYEGMSHPAHASPDASGYEPEDEPQFAQTPHRIHGRGTAHNPPNRFVPIAYEPDPEEQETRVRTQLFRDAGRSIITTNASPDIPFEASLNPYRGCEHGCAYCYARPFHEYLGLSAGLDFETKLFVKEDAPELLRRELASPRWQPKLLVLSGVTDPYQPVERKLQLTRACLKVLAAFRNPVSIITKNHLATRDIDLLAPLAREHAASVYLSITTLDPELQRTLEPRAASPQRRLDAVRALSEAGIPTGVMVAPVIPGLTEPEIPAILKAAAEAGAVRAGYIVLRLPHAVAPLFTRWLETHAPERRDKVLHRIEALRGGRLNDPRFGSRMRGEGIFAREIEALFALGRKQSGLSERSLELSTAAFRRPCQQLDLF